MSKQILNPKWLVGAVVYTETGERFGTVSKAWLKGGDIVVMSAGVAHEMNAYDLDAKGCIQKPYAVHKKFIKK